MLLPPFVAPRAKVDRALRHIKEIDREIELWANDEKHERWGFFHAPVAVPLALGDAIHNLRCALDHLACDVVRLNEKGTKDVYFPFGVDPTTLEEQIKKKNFDRAAPEAVQLLREQEPWRGGKLALRAIHDLDIADKHELIIPVLSMRGKLVSDQTLVAIYSTCFACGKDRKEMSYIRPGEPAIEGIVFFPQEAPLRGEVVPVLESLAKNVSGVIEAFKTLLLP